MATFHDRTVAPKFQRGLLRSAGTPCRVLTSGEVIDLLDAGTAPTVATLATVEAEFADLIARPWPGALSVQSDPKPAWLNEKCSDVGDADLGENEKRSAGSLASTTATALLPAEPDTAAQARALHARRELHQALDYGFALLDALDLPPLALDVIDDAIAHLDALDAPREDLEPSLGWTESGPRFCGDYQDCELDTADWEPNLATPEQHPGVSHCSAPWSYVDRGPDSSQLRWAQGAQHDGEAVNEDGDDLDVGEHDKCDKEPSIGWPNDYRAVLSDAFQADHDPEEVNEDGDAGEEPWWDPMPSRQTTTEGVHV